MGTKILNSIVKKSIVGDVPEEQQKQNYTEYIQSINNIKTNMPTLFPEFIQDMVGYMIITLPTNIILFILAIIPIPMPHVLVESMLIKIKKDLNDIVNLIIDASASNKSNEPENNSTQKDTDLTTPLLDRDNNNNDTPSNYGEYKPPDVNPERREDLNDLEPSEPPLNAPSASFSNDPSAPPQTKSQKQFPYTPLQERRNPSNRGGTRKIKRRNKYTKKYYLNRIHNTIKNFYKTNKRKSRYNKKRL
jgi:hypothetical protein